MKVLGIDPGKTTGWVVVDTDNVILHGQVAFDDAPKLLDSLIVTVNFVAIERFTIGPRTLQLSRQMEAVYVIGGTIFLCELSEVPWGLQTPADAKAAFTDDYLKTIEMFDKVAGRHARDALRHALLAIRRNPTI